MFAKPTHIEDAAFYSRVGDLLELMLGQVG